MACGGGVTAGCFRGIYKLDGMFEPKSETPFMDPAITHIGTAVYVVGNGTENKDKSIFSTGNDAFVVVSHLGWAK